MTPENLLLALTSIFPSFQAEWETENPYIHEDGSFTFHSVFLEFTDFFGVQAAKSSTKQLLATATIINDAVSDKSDLENAVSTCFLEHLHQIKAVKYLRPYLNERALAEVRA